VPRLPLLASATALTLLLTGTAGIATAEGESPSSTPEATAESANQPPVAVADEATASPGSSVRVPVLENDTDDGKGRPDGEPARLEVVGVEGAEDRATFSPTDVTFTARSGDQGPYVFYYDVSDGELVSRGQVTVRVEEVSSSRGVTISMAESPAALKRYPISGKVSGRKAALAEVRVQRRTSDGWKTLGRDDADAEGRYSVGFTTARPGAWKFRSVAVWPDGDRATSSVLRRTVRAVPDTKVSGPLTARQVPHSWRRGCPVPPSQLRKIHINRINYKKLVARGSVVVRASEVGDIVKVLEAAIAERFPIRTLKPADAFYAGGGRTPMESDKAAMRAGNTSAFNCRPVVGNPYRVSQHSYGNAIDINTIENPYVTGSRVYPPGSRSYLDRSPYRRGMILHGGVIADRMRRLGWLWGARWGHPDYQHFSSNGG
jgi:hypothetical protein